VLHRQAEVGSTLGARRHVVTVTDGVRAEVQVAILNADSADAVPYEGGATARLIDDKQNGLASSLLTSAAGAPLTDAALFIDANSQTLGPDAQTKFLFWGPWWGCAPPPVPDGCWFRVRCWWEYSAFHRPSHRLSCVI